MHARFHAWLEFRFSAVGYIEIFTLRHETYSNKQREILEIEAQRNLFTYSFCCCSNFGISILRMRTVVI